MGPSVLVIGAGGNFGSAVMSEFIRQNSTFGRVGVLTDQSREHRFTPYTKHGIDLVLGSYFDPEMYKGFEVVISLAGNANMKDQSGMIDAAAAGGVRQFYPSEYGADLSIPALASVRYFRDKHLTRQRLVDTAKEFSSFRYTLLLVGSFTEWAISDFFGVDTDKHTVETYGDPNARINNTASTDAAKYLVSSIFMPWKDPDSPVRTIRVAGDTMTWKQLVDTLGEIQGAVYTHHYLDPGVAHKKEEEAHEANDFGGEMAWSAKPLAASGYSIVGLPLDNDLFDFKPETVKETLQRVYGKLVLIVDLESRWGNRLAPEVSRESILDAGWTEKSDIYDLGYLIKGMVYGNVPITNTVEWAVPSPLNVIVEACTPKVPEQRPSLDDLYNMVDGIEVM